MTQTNPLENLYTEELYRSTSRVLILIQKPWVQVDEAERTLLGKILTALKLSLASVQLISRKEFEIEDVKTFRPSCVIAFGAVLNGSSKMYENVGTGETPVVVAHELNQLDETRKKNLWLALKQIFQS